VPAVLSAFLVSVTPALLGSMMAGHPVRMGVESGESDLALRLAGFGALFCALAPLWRHSGRRLGTPTPARTAIDRADAEEGRKAGSSLRGR